MQNDTLTWHFGKGKIVGVENTSGYERLGCGEGHAGVGGTCDLEGIV